MGEKFGSEDYTVVWKIFGDGDDILYSISERATLYFLADLIGEGQAFYL